MQLLADIDEDTVDLIANYDGTSEEPSVLPARFPNLLVNGSQGIAVGQVNYWAIILEMYVGLDDKSSPCAQLELRVFKMSVCSVAADTLCAFDYG